MTCQKNNTQKGVGLIEVLVSLMVITIGVLGMAGLHSHSLQHNQAAYLHSRATFLAGDMLDRIRTNHTLAKSSNSYEVGMDDEIIAQCNEASYPDSCEIGQCSQQQLALYDIKQWKFQLACELPGTRGAITFSDSDDSRLYTIELDFPDQMQGNQVGNLTLREAL